MYLALHSFDEIGRFPVTRSPNMRTCKANFRHFQNKEDSPRRPYFIEVLFKCFLLCRFFPSTFMMNRSRNSFQSWQRCSGLQTTELYFPRRREELVVVPSVSAIFGRKGPPFEQTVGGSAS